MKWLETTIAFLVPSILIGNTPWRDVWQKQQNEAFVRLSRFTLLAAGVGWAAHHHLFDIPMGLEPIEFWFALRFYLGLFLAACGLFYFTPLAQRRFYQLPAFIGIFSICHAEAWVTVWYGKEAWFFFFLFVLVGNMMLRLNPLYSLLWGGFVIAASTPVLIQGEVGLENIMSGVIASLFISAIVRAGAITEVRLFIANQQNAANQKKMLDMTSEYSERVKSFIPRVIADRLSDLMDNHRLSVVEASIEALKARKKNVACLFTDIRGFTQGSKNIDSFVSESVLPEVTACSDAIEALQGIPRKVGDLIFAYFDDSDLQTNVLRSLLAGIEVARVNESVNSTLGSEEIRRYILISSGEALVGNFGGLDSSIEITALGSPVNFLSRVDDLTKAPSLANLLRPGDLVVCANTARHLREMGIELPFMCLDLDQLELHIRDFPEVRTLYKLSPTDDVYDKLLDCVRAKVAT